MLWNGHHNSYEGFLALTINLGETFLRAHTEGAKVIPPQYYHNNLCFLCLGISLLLHHIATRLYSDSPDKSRAYLLRALRLLNPVLSQTDTHRSTFLCGAGGPLAVGAIIHSQLGNSDKAAECVTRLQQLFTDQKSSFTKLPSELLFGHSGYLYALLLVKANVPKLVDDSLVGEVVEIVLALGERQKEVKYDSPLMYTWHGKHYLGAAHGLAGILTILLQVQYIICCVPGNFRGVQFSRLVSDPRKSKLQNKRPHDLCVEQSKTLPSVK